MNRLIYASKNDGSSGELVGNLLGLALLHPIFNIFKEQLGLESVLTDLDGRVVLSTLTDPEDGQLEQSPHSQWLDMILQSTRPGEVASIGELRVTTAPVTGGGKTLGNWLFYQREQDYLANPTKLSQVAELLPQMAESLGDIVSRDLSIAQYVGQIDADSRELLEHLDMQIYIRDTFTTLLCFTDTDEAISYALSSMGRRFNLSRVCIFEDQSDQGTTNNTYEWCAPGVMRIKEDCQNLPYRAEGHGENFDSQGIFVCHDTSKLPDEQRWRFEAHETKSILQCMLMVGQQPIGILSFDECRYCRTWNDSEIAAVVMLSKIITTLILRRNMYATLIQAMEEMVEREQRIRRQLDLQDFINKVYEEVFTSDSTQDTIHRILEMVGKKYRVSRIGLCEVLPNRVDIINTAQWCGPNILPMMHMSRTLVYADYDAFCQAYHGRDGSFYCKDVGQLEDGVFTQLLRERGVVSTLQTTIRVNNCIEGYIYVEECTNRLWSNDEVAALKLTTRAMAAIVLRNRERDRLAQSYRMMDTVLSNVNTWVYVVNAHDFTVRYVNTRMEQDLAYPVERGEVCYKALSKGQQKCVVCPIRQLDAECNLGTVEGYDPQLGIWYNSTSTKAQWVDGTEVYIVTVNDIDQQKSKVLEMEKTAYYDPLLNIKNRAAFIDDFNSRLIQGADHKNVGAVIIFDVNDFKYINQTFGLAAGDGLLRQIAAYLTSLPNTHERVYRYGGDEFVVILEGSDVRRAEMVAATISKRFEQVWRVDNNDYYCTIAMGIALYPEHGSNSHEMIATLDFALSEAKTIGRGSNQTISFYNKLGERLRRKHDVLDALKLALKHDWFEVHYQPIYSPQEQAFTKMEALLRMKSDNDVFYPSEFIPVAEETGLIKEIGMVVLDKVCAAIAQMLADGIQFQNIHVNISAVQMMQDDFAALALEIIRRHGIPPSKLEFEITESVLSSSIERVRQVIHQLQQEGISFAIDDFGTGYSNFTYIFSLPFNILKFDKAVISQLEDNAISSTIIRSMISNCHEFGIQTVAEGIETPEQYLLLRSFGCDYIQGYLFAKPVKAENLPRYFGNELTVGAHQPSEIDTIDNQEMYDLSLPPIEEMVPGGIYRCKNNPQRILLGVNNGFLEQTSCTKKYLQKECNWQLTELIHPDDRAKVADELTRQLAAGNSFELEYRVMTEGGTRWLLDKGRVILRGGESYQQGIVVDITNLQTIREEYEYICYHDPLTGLYNRAYFEREIAQLSQQRGVMVGLIFCDMDGLKLINDHLGHQVGDRLIISAAEIISKSVGREDIVCRMGGDEFAVILLNCTQEKLAERMEAIRNNVTLNNQNPDALPVRISIGSASAVTNEEGLMKKLSRTADVNMYEDKRINITAAREFILKRITQLSDKKLL